MTSRICRRFPEQRLTRDEALKGTVHCALPGSFTGGISKTLQE